MTEGELDIEGRLLLKTNFGEIDIRAGIAPHIECGSSFNAHCFDTALSLAATNGFAIIRNMTAPDVNDAVAKIKGRRSHPFKTIEDNFTTIRPDIIPSTVARTRKYHALHSDNAWVRAKPRYIFFLMEKQADFGGESFIVTRKCAKPFLSGLGLSPGGIEIVGHRPNGPLVQSLFPISNGVFDLTYSPFAHYFESKSPADFVAFSRLVRGIEELMPRYVVRLEDGDALVLDNRACLHGRNSFEGERIARRAWFS